MARQHSELRPTSPAMAICLMLLAVLSFIVALGIIIALTRIVLG